MSQSSAVRHAACHVCRRSKIRCDTLQGDARCKRCTQLGCECVRPDFHPGRQKGIRNKRVGVDKALYQIEEAVRRAKSGQHQTADDDRVLGRLRSLLGDVPNGEATETPFSASHESVDADLSHAALSDGGGLEHHEYEDGGGDEGEDEDEDGESGTIPEFVTPTEDSPAIDDAENPLQLLARASYFQPSGDTPRQQPSMLSPHRGLLTRDADGADGTDGDPETQSFFTPGRVKLDVGDDIDPVCLGLVTEQEASSLFSIFHANLAHTRWGLDPRIYTLEYTRSRSAFLFTSILAASALFMPSAVAISKRLSNHVRLLANQVVLQRFKSVEIVLAYMVNVPWMFPGENSTDDDTATYMSMAMAIAVDLSLHKVLVSSEMFRPDSGLSLARGECIDSRTALDIDGLTDVESWSDRGVLLLRGRERAWIALFVLERGMCLARGRPFTVPITRSLKDCDGWHRSSHAHSQDGHLVSMAVLRRDLDGLFATVRALCDGSQQAISDGSLVAQEIQTMIEAFFDQWNADWRVSIGIGPERRFPPYVEILVTHTRLSTYGSVINHPTAPLQVRRFFRTAGLSSALNVMRTAIQGEGQLQSMPNNTAIMISFAACFALALSTYATGGSTLAPSIRKLINETSSVLERVGMVTNHRNGLSTLYGRHLKAIVRKAAAGRNGTLRPPETQPTNVAFPLSVPAQTAIAPAPDFVGYSPLLWPETVQFSAMSDDQIMNVLNQAGNEFEPSFNGFSWQDMSNFDWLHWPEFGA